MKLGPNCFAISLSIFFLGIVMPLGIISIIVSQIGDDQCDYADAMGLNIKQYLLGGGIASLLTAFVGFITTMGTYYAKTDRIPLVGTTIVIVLNILFGIAWFVVGAIIIFRSNIECIQQGSALLKYM